MSVSGDPFADVKMAKMRRECFSLFYLIFGGTPRRGETMGLVKGLADQPGEAEGIENNTPKPLGMHACLED